MYSERDLRWRRQMHWVERWKRIAPALSMKWEEVYWVVRK